MNGRPTVEELEHLYASLNREECDDLLQELHGLWLPRVGACHQAADF